MKFFTLLLTGLLSCGFAFSQTIRKEIAAFGIDLVPKIDVGAEP